MKDIYPKIHSPKFKDQFYFELNGWIGRNFYKHKSNINKFANSEPIYLDIGAGRNYKKGWVHVDFYKTRIRKFWKKYSGHNPDIETDLRKPLYCKDNIIDGIYSGHTLEHLYFEDAYNLLNECFRVIKPGGWLRINVPDLKRVIDFYNDEIQIEHFKFKAEAIAHLTQNHGHVSVWDEELLSFAIRKSGFINVKKVKFGKEGSNPFLIKEEEYRREETLVIEAQKPI